MDEGVVPRSADREHVAETEDAELFVYEWGKADSRWDFADLPGFDAGAGLDARIEAARRRRAKDSYATWDEYLDAERRELGRWTAAVADAHRATRREQDGRIVPILEPDVVGAIHHGNCLEPTAATHPALRAADMPILLVTPSAAGGPVSRAGLERFRRNVPRFRLHALPCDVHDLVSAAAPELAAVVGRWLATEPAQPPP